MTNTSSASTHTTLAQKIAGLFAALPQVEAVALGGSLTGGTPDAASDIDLYVYTRGDIPVAERAAIVERSGGAERADLGLEYWGSGDEWFDADTGIEVDLVYFDAAWMEGQLKRVLDAHLASMGYSTCFWATILHSHIYYDPHGWLTGLQTRCRQPYPEALRRNIIRLNYPVLRQIIPAYANQVDKAVKRRDLVSINHRVATLLASYFDIILAVNRQLHPGEKRLVSFAETNCPHLPVDMAADLHAVLTTTDETLPGHLARLLEHLDVLLKEEGLI